MDSSRGVTNTVYKKEKDLINLLAKHFKISPTGPRGSAVMYADNPYTIASFVEQNFKARVDSAPFLNKPRRTDRALQQAAQLLSSSKGRKIVVLFTAGEQAKGARPLEEAIQPLRKIGAQTFVVSVGRGVDNRRLLPVVDRSNDIYRVISPDKLLSLSTVIAKEIREKPGEYP